METARANTETQSWEVTDTPGNHLSANALDLWTCERILVVVASPIGGNCGGQQCVLVLCGTPVSTECIQWSIVQGLSLPTTCSGGLTGIKQPLLRSTVPTDQLCMVQPVGLLLEGHSIVV
jgi:hypothetical protein